MANPTNSPLILLVDDDAPLLQSLTRLLESEQYNVLALSSADAAWKYLARSNQHFDAVITDLSMPGMTGLEFLSRLKQLRPHLPVIVITAFGDADCRRRALQSSAFACLCKPLNVPDFLDVLHRAVEQDGHNNHPPRGGAAE